MLLFGLSVEANMLTSWTLPVTLSIGSISSRSQNLYEENQLTKNMPLMGVLKVFVLFLVSVSLPPRQMLPSATYFCHDRLFYFELKIRGSSTPGLKVMQL